MVEGRGPQRASGRRALVEVGIRPHLWSARVLGLAVEQLTSASDSGPDGRLSWRTH